VYAQFPLNCQARLQIVSGNLASGILILVYVFSPVLGVTIDLTQILIDTFEERELRKSIALRMSDKSEERMESRDR
jgi:hypothetical protein